MRHFEVCRVCCLFFFLVAAALHAQQPRVTLSPQALPRDVIYRTLFREIAAYQAEADRLAAQSKPDAFVRHYHESVLQLSAAQFAQVKNVALGCVQQIQAIDLRAKEIIDTTKNQFKNVPKTSPKAIVPPPPQELAELEVQRSAIVLAAADTIATALGPAQFSYFENLTRRHVGSGLKASTTASNAQ
jgi:hypothetical protein